VRPQPRLILGLVGPEGRFLVAGGTAPRSLPQVGARSFGVAMPAISNVYFGEVVYGIEAEAAAHGFIILLADTHDRTTDEIRAVADFLERGRPGHGRSVTPKRPSSLNRHGAKCRGWCAAPAEITPA
jgi:hypothetical protein